MSVVVVGSLNLDITIRVHAVPAPGETVLASGVVEEPGGKGANQAAAAAALGSETFMVGAVGDDAHGRMAREALERAGVRVDGVITTSRPTGAAYVTLDEHGENSIAVVAGANGSLDAAAVTAALDDVAPSAGGDCVLVASLEVPLEGVLAAARFARGRGWSIVLNPAPARELTHELLALVDVLTPNETEARSLGGAAALFEAGVGAIVATRGGDGCQVLRRDGFSSIIGGVEAVVANTTGAGDVFTAALASALSEGARLDDAARFANAAGAIAVESPASRVPSLTRETVMERLLR